MKKPHIIIIGAGISGATLAQRYALMGKRVLVLEKRDHIGGNCYDYYNEDGILISKYGAHLFHTNDFEVWAYINSLSDWYPYEHRVLASVNELLVPIPVNITTVNKLFGLSISSETEMKAWLAKEQLKIKSPKNSEEAALARVGPRLYELMFKNYTKKQWDKWPNELDREVLERIPVRTNFDDRYFSDTYQFLPKNGYTRLFENMLDHPRIDVRLEIDYFDVRRYLNKYQKLFYTGPIDRYFDYKFNSGKSQLEYRSINFTFETHAREFFQSNSVINYPNENPYTRIVEYKHFTRQKHAKTTISKEISTNEGEPYYPVPNPKNRALYAKYQKEAVKLHKVFFVGRLANYKYFNMDQAFKNALDLFKFLEGKEYVINKSLKRKLGIYEELRSELTKDYSLPSQ